MRVRELGADELEGAIDSFREHGFVKIESLVPAESLEVLRGRLDALMRGEVQVDGLFFQHDTTSGRYDDLEFGHGYVGPSLNYRKLEKLERDPVFRLLIENASFGAIVRRLVGNDVTLYRAIAMNKSARGDREAGGTELPWHQDGGKFWGLTEDPTLQIWTALDDAHRASGCVEVWPGSHRMGLATPLGGVVPAPIVASRPVSPVAIEANAGDVVLLHNLVWHRSGVNATDRPRRALSFCYLPAHVRCTRKKHAPRVFPRVEFG